MGLDVDRILKNKSLSRSKLADLLGSNRSYVTNALKNPTIETLEKIANALEVDIRELFTPDTADGELNGFVEYNGEIHKINTKQDLEQLLKVVE